MAIVEQGSDASWERRRDDLVLSHLPLVERLARRFAGRGETMEDLVQIGSIGLLKAAERFDPDRGVPFEAYASLVVGGELRRHLRDLTWPVRLPRSAWERGQRVATQELSSATPSDVDGFAPVEQRELLRPGLASLDEREREIVRLRFYGDLSQERIASRLGLSQVHVSRLLRRSLGKLEACIGER